MFFTCMCGITHGSLLHIHMATDSYRCAHMCHSTSCRLQSKSLSSHKSLHASGLAGSQASKVACLHGCLSPFCQSPWLPVSSLVLCVAGLHVAPACHSSMWVVRRAPVHDMRTLHQQLCWLLGPYSRAGAHARTCLSVQTCWQHAGA